jgi:hypothetical protein
MIRRMFAVRRPLVRLRLVPQLALVLLLAQFGAQLHVLAHSGTRTDPPSLPGHHTQLCGECASFAPLLALQGGPVALPGIAPAAVVDIAATAATEPGELAHFRAFRSRAPPV